ncbi:Hybrid sensor histidine kinase/response regulator [Tenacibaculum sp. 190524A02b]|uniref:histidine kinase n=1 Tax=Tenacibaculum vairaonense TaxID=3137860 RepID=A0ABP1F9N1_9FLAO
MKVSKNKIAFKVLFGYTILGVLAIISGLLIFAEVKRFVKVHEERVLDDERIIHTGSLIASIYENENLGRAAIQLNSRRKFNEYVVENKKILLNIDSLSLSIKDSLQKNILDTIRLVLINKRKNIKSLKKLTRWNASEKSINEAINKLSSINSLFDKISIKNLVENSQFLDYKTRNELEEYFRLVNKFNDVEKSTRSKDEKQIDSLVSVSKNILQKAKIDNTNKKRSLLLKERELIENDLTISKKLREIISVLENNVVTYTNRMHLQRRRILNRSKNIIFLGSGFSFIIVVFFSFIILNDFWKSQHFRVELENANEKTSSLLKSREQLISMVGHDLRTPLSTVIGYSELLQNATVNTKEKNYITHIQNASVYMRRLVGDLLELSKLENGEISIESVPFDLEKLLNEVVVKAKDLISNKPITIVFIHDKTINTNIISDPFRLKQILYNLVTNACKFTEKGTVTLKSNLVNTKEGKKLKIEVIDTGVGISESEQKRVFKAFTQVGTNIDGEKGFGLGLTISNILARLLGGALTLKSSLGKGSSFILSIPVNLSNRSLKEKRRSNVESVTYNLRAIVVEDDIVMGKLLKQLLNSLGIEVFLFSNAQAALESISGILYDFVLTDIQLPRMNGVHFMEVLKKEDFYNGQPVIAMTGRASLVKSEYIKNGFSEVLFKPFHPDELEQIIQHFFYEIIKMKGEKLNGYKAKGFDISSLETFLNYDELAVKNTLTLFLKDSKNNFLKLEKAKNNNDLSNFKAINHKMLPMFRQLNVIKIVLFMEKFEIAKKVNDSLFLDFKKELDIFIFELESYLS